MAWLASHGRLSNLDLHFARDSYLFISWLGIECVFFISDDVFRFVGDHHIFSVPIDEVTWQP